MSNNLGKRKCSCGCKQPATGGTGLVAWASLDCAVRIAEKRREKLAIKERRERRERLKTRRDWLNEAQAAFNAYIRERDRHQPCICCGASLYSDSSSSGSTGGAFDCGHYRSVGSAPHLRFDERNAHGQRKQCNRYGGGRAVDYRLGLISRIGIGEVEALEADQSVKKWTVQELMAIKAEYKAKLRALIAERERKAA